MPPKRRKRKKKKRAGDEDGQGAQYGSDPGGYSSLSNNGSEAEFPGDGADFEGVEPLNEVAKKGFSRSGKGCGEPGRIMGEESLAVHVLCGECNTCAGEWSTGE